MHRNGTSGDRRRLLKLTASAALAAGGLSGFLSRALAAGRVPQPPGVREMKGDVRINRRPAQIGQLVQPGDTVTTGKASQAVIIIGRDAFLLRANTELVVRGQRESRGAGGELREMVIEALQVTRGALLSVFGKGQKRIDTPTATLGIRGTGLYVETENERDYICTCYGTVEIVSRHDKRVSEVVRTRRHDMPRYVTGGSAPGIGKAPIKNHTDAELTMLEALVGRYPPFDPNDPYRY
jgi:hypothetical protein